jgi:hypothetical protein
MSKKRSNNFEKTETAESTESWIDYYLTNAQGVIARKNIEELRSYRAELWNLLHGIELRWLPKGFLALFFRRTYIETGYYELLRLESKLKRDIETLVREQVLLERMKSSALPDPGGSNATRNVSKWNQRPSKYSDLLLSKRKTARLPQSKRG